MTTTRKTLETLLAQSGSLPQGASPDNIVELGEILWGISSKSARSFLKNAAAVISCFTREDVTESELLGGGRVLWMEPLEPPHPAKPRAAPDRPVLSSGWRQHLNGWFEQGKRLSLRRPDTGVEYFASTAAFLRREKIFRIKQWADCAHNILDLGNGFGSAAVDFFRWSTGLLEFMPFKEVLEWKTLGLQIAQHARGRTASYFSSIPRGLDSLYRSERAEIHKLSSFLAQPLPLEAFEFYKKGPSSLLNVSPAVRKQVLLAVQKTAPRNPETVSEDFSVIIDGLRNLPFPDQEGVMSIGAELARVSPEALRAYYRNVGVVLNRIHAGFLKPWADRGMSFFPDEKARGVDYFHLNLPLALEELSRWEEAVMLEDHRPVLTLFVRGLTGKNLGLQSTDEVGAPGGPGARYYPTCDGETVYLPPFVAEGKTREENFRYYRVAAAHQAGYVEFKSFEFGIGAILERIDRLPFNELARDIFYILEDGRIDRLIRNEYPGLGKEMDLLLCGAIPARPPLDKLPALEAIVEGLLRFSLDRLDPSACPGGIKGVLFHVIGLLSGFYPKARGVWDCFYKTLEIYDYLSRLPWRRAYRPMVPLFFHGRLDPDLIAEKGQLDLASCEGEAGAPPEPLETVLENLKELSIENAGDAEAPFSRGSYAAGLEGAQGEEPRGDAGRCHPAAWKQPFAAPVSRSASGEGAFFYDEWDYFQQDYRRRWCQVHQKAVTPADPGRIDAVYAAHRDLIRRVRKQFQQIRPSCQEIVRRVEWGDEIDLPAMIQSVVDRRNGHDPSDRIFLRKEKRTRRISTALLVDMSASTDKTVPLDSNPIPENKMPGKKREKKIIDIEIETLVVIMEALDALDDEYAIFGFSGSGRENVDFFVIKDFGDPYSDALKRRIGGIMPRESTRMGAAVRHAVNKLKTVDSDQRLLIVLSDGYPQDYDYGEDRSSEDYGLHDTMMALLEAKREGIRPFCITVDRSGHDYLRKMCDPRNYLVIQDAYSLPEILPKVVESLMA